jgi:hypothetical protein
MNFSIIRLFLFSTLLISLLQPVAAEVSQAEFQALLQRVEQLEGLLRVTRNAQVEKIAQEAAAQMPMAAKDRQSFIEDVVGTIQKKEEAANYPWMDAVKWDRVRKGMSPGAVVKVLGLPTLDEPSLHKRKDRVYTWQGRRVATAKKVEGIVRFYKGKVIEIEPPVLR